MVSPSQIADLYLIANSREHQEKISNHAEVKTSYGTYWVLVEFIDLFVENPKSILNIRQKKEYKIFQNQRLTTQK